MSNFPKIYNLFPRLAGPMTKWIEHIKRAEYMGFNYIYINPIHYPGFSGSLYAVKDYYKFNPMFVDETINIPPEQQFKNFINVAHNLGLKVIMDLVINHTAIDSVLVQQHPEWYKRNPDGSIKHPGALDNGVWVEWGDLAEIDNENSIDRENLWKYWLDLVMYYIEEYKVDGFRADAAYQVPKVLWEYLISNVKDKYPHIEFFAETLGCTPEETRNTASAGFDYVFNSAKWWNYNDNWFLEQNNLLARFAKTIAFPESHDTPRIAQELYENLKAIKQRLVFTTLVSTGVLIPIGFEFGFKKKLNVINTTPNDWEPIRYDITEYIKNLLKVKGDFEILHKDGYLERWYLDNNMITVLVKKLENNPRKALFLINRDMLNPQAITVNLKDIFGETDVRMIDIEAYRYIDIPEPVRRIELEPSDIKVFINIL